MSSNTKNYVCILIVMLLFGGLQTSYAQKPTRKQLEERRASLIAEMQQLTRLRETNKKKEISLLTQVEDLDQQIKVRSDIIKVTNRQANLLSQEIDENLNKMENLRDELKDLKDDYALMIQKSYKSKSGQSKIMFLLSSESFKQAYKRMQYMKQYTNYRKKQGEQIKERTALLQKVNRDLIDQKKDKEALIAENRLARKELDKEKQAQDELVAQVRKKSSVYASQIRKKQQQTDEIDRQIDKIIADAIAASNVKAGKSKSNKKFSLTPEEKTLASNFAANKGRLIWPVERGRVSRRFGKTRHPTLPNITTYSSGVEIETSPDEKVRAVFKGEVLKIQDVSGSNLAVYIKHGDYITVYYNIKKITVKVGDKVDFKQVIGEVGLNAFNGKTILKFLVRKNNTKLNPADWIKGM
ncbi:peptidoglycan DD-metalloendopeptidase family protein [uncultured Dokdonia sp.]|uniref:murein hydrolase activator EnvC family protein n=1 Tax=uncultured Dokdonia sp. TaxID=575653 RepID=UPI00261EDE00|nr:peptidoglycan DD-metalloendopeptidase family protein [uncultured Dokdonia sp.]